MPAAVHRIPGLALPRRRSDAVTPRRLAARHRYLGVVGVVVAAFLGPAASAPAPPRPAPGIHDLEGHEPGARAGARPARVPVVVPGRPRVSRGLEPRAVSHVVSRRLPELVACYRRALEITPRTRGRLVARIVVGADGNVIQGVAGTDTLGHPELTRCVLAAIRTWRFPKPDVTGGWVQVEQPLEFKVRG